MPELPEVETIRLTLRPKLLGRKITGAEISYEKMLQGWDSHIFSNQITGKKIKEVDRRGKYLLLRLTDAFVLGLHLRMTGQLSVEDQTSETAKATYFKLRLDNQTELRFRDQRKFGKIFLYPEANPPQSIASLGLEPLAADFGVTDFQQRLAGRKLAIKKALLNQEIIAGIGNIYADEALFVAGIMPDREVTSLSAPEITRLYQAIRQVLSEGIQYRGTTKRDYLDGEGRPGQYQERLRVYGRKGQPCRNCRGEIKKINFGGRGTHFCPNCQK